MLDATETLDFAMFDLPAMTAAEAAAAKATRERKADAAHRTAEREGAEDPRIPARAAADRTT